MLARTVLAVVALSAAFGYAKDQCDPGKPYQGPAPRSALKAGWLPANSRVEMPEFTSQVLDEKFLEIRVKLPATAGTVLLVDPRRGSWTRNFGTDQDQPVFWWASVGKLVTAVVIHQMIEEGSLAHASTLNRWFSDWPLGEQITIDDLLAHRSGIFSFNTDKKFRDERGYHSPQELLDIATRHRPDFCPGTNCYYSNTGYVLLAMIAQQIDGQPFHEIVEQRIAIPLRLASLIVVTPGMQIPHVILPADDDRTTLDEIATVHGAGGIVANAKDMLVLLNAILTGRIVGSSELLTMFDTLTPMFNTPLSYGRGVMVIDVPDADKPTTWLGHIGGAPGAKALVIYDAPRRVWVAVAVNRVSPVEALVNMLLKQLDELDQI
ncbi:MAG: serine hydrolase [Proteobacteria bacterium]|nr:serine hydrolase [Pseudomonadota bacterium]